MKVDVVVVTYNRKVLLIECLQSLLRQTYPVNRIILIDNASTDGTMEILKEKGFLDLDIMDYHLMESNLGGSGGFYEGLKIASNMQSDWVWIMDDDSIPDNDCLEQLIIKANNNISFLASCVYGINNEPMNIPEIDFTPSDNGYPFWYERLDESMITIKTATFVSILVNMNAIKKCGLPCKDYFIWGDDVEYTQRLVKYYGKAYFVGKSRVCHKRVNAARLDIKSEKDPKRIRNYYYYYRNNLINTMLYNSKKDVCIVMLNNILKSIILLFSSPKGGTRAKAVMTGMLSAVITRKKFVDYVNGEIKSSLEK